MDNWQDISTAPKDGRMLLLWDDGLHKGSWTLDDNYQHEDPQWFDDIYDDYSCGYSSCPLNPTHWIPYPQEPGTGNE